MRVRIDLMWQRLSFSAQLFLPLGVMFVTALIMGGIPLHVFTTGQLAEENRTAQRSPTTAAAADNVFGRGLTGMRERVRALSGSLSLLRADERTYVRCRLPVDAARGVPVSS